MSRLADVVDAAASSATPIADLLRQVRIVASRADATDVDAWAAGELNGFPNGTVAPTYRGPFLAPVFGTWMSVARYVENATLSRGGVPQDFIDAWFMVTLRQPVAELEAFTKGEGEARLPWDPYAIATYDGYARQGLVAHPEGHHLMSAHTSIPQGHIIGLLDTIRTRVLELALDLERVEGGVGEPGGPTVDNKQVAAAAQTFVINVYGDGTNIATGDYANLRSKVRKGDEASLHAAVAALGISSDDADEFIASVKEDGSPTGSRTKRFIERVRTGAISLSGNIAANIAADQLIQMAEAFLG